jgi:hypothetical protein
MDLVSGPELPLPTVKRFVTRTVTEQSQSGKAGPKLAKFLRIGVAGVGLAVMAARDAFTLNAARRARGVKLHPRTAD